MKNTLFAQKIRLYTLKSLRKLGFGHIGGALSICDILAVLFNEKIDNYDKFILSKGHAGPSYYATLYLKGAFDLDFLYSLNTNGTKLPSHPDLNLTPKVDVTTGSLGQGISIAAGIAYKFKNDNKNNKVYCILGDGEMNEGQVYEAFQFINHHKLNNLIIFIDDNKKQLDGYTKDICEQLDYVKKCESFGLYSRRIDGHNLEEISKTIDWALKNDNSTVIICDTIKAKGIKEFEDRIDNHHMRFNENDLKILDKYIQKLEKEVNLSNKN